MRDPEQTLPTVNFMTWPRISAQNLTALTLPTHEEARAHELRPALGQNAIGLFHFLRQLAPA